MPGIDGGAGGGGGGSDAPREWTDPGRLAATWDADLRAGDPASAAWVADADALPAVVERPRPGAAPVLVTPANSGGVGGGRRGAGAGAGGAGHPDGDDRGVVAVHDTTREACPPLAGGRVFVTGPRTFGTPSAFRAFCCDRGLSEVPVGLARGGTLEAFLWVGDDLALATTVDPVTGAAPTPPRGPAGRAADPGDAGRVCVAGPPAAAVGAHRAVQTHTDPHPTTR